MIIFWLSRKTSQLIFPVVVFSRFIDGEEVSSYFQYLSHLLHYCLNNKYSIIGYHNNVVYMWLILIHNIIIFLCF